MPKTVLFTASTLSHIRNFHLPYLAAFHEQGWTVHVAYAGEEGSLPEADALIHLPLEKKMSSPKNFSASRLLRLIIRENNYDLVITHTSLAAFFTRLAMKGLKRRPPLINVVHGYLFDESTGTVKKMILEAAEHFTAPQTDLLLTMNQWDYDIACRKHWGKRVEMIPGMGIDLSRFDEIKESSAALRRQWGWDEKCFILIYAAEFSARKNQELLLRAMKQLPPRVCLVLPGQGALLEHCKTLAAETGIGNRVLFPGQVTDMPRWLAAADAAVTTSRSEGLPFNVMEAMATGLPVIASAVKGHTDLITDGSNGVLFPKDSADQLAEAVSRLLSEPKWREQLARSAQETIKNYALSAVLPQVMAQYLSVLPDKVSVSANY